jgi:hypothetical protein
MTIYFIYREVSRFRQELIGRADRRHQATKLALEHSRRQGCSVRVDACTPATLESHILERFRNGALFELEPAGKDFS